MKMVGAGLRGEGEGGPAPSRKKEPPPKDFGRPFLKV